MHKVAQTGSIGASHAFICRFIHAGILDSRVTTVRTLIHSYMLVPLDFSKRSILEKRFSMGIKKSTRTPRESNGREEVHFCCDVTYKQ